MTVTAPAPDVPAWPQHVADAYRRDGRWTDVTLFDMVADAARRHPEHEALVDGDRSWAYAELVAEVTALAAGLRTLADVGDRVVVQLPNQAEAVLTTLACLAAGVVPLWALPQHGEREIGAFVRHCDARVLVTTAAHRDVDLEHLAHRVAATCPSLEHVVVTGAPRWPGSVPFATLARGRRVPADGPPSADALAVLIPSGGTTGASKIVPRTHNDLGCLLRAAVDAAGFDATTRYLVVLPLGHGFANTGPGVLGTLVSGGTVVVSPSPSPATALALAERHRATATSVVPAVLQRWVDHLEGTTARPTTLRLVQSGAALLSPELADAAERHLGCVVQQVYGMSEGLTCMTGAGDPLDVRRTTQGMPLSPDDELRVVDERGEEVPAGTVGVLTVRGPYTIRGYYRSPEVDGHAFTADGRYVTGDLVVLRPDGRVVVKGRLGDTINRGGEKISAHEVEGLLRDLPGVADCAVVGVPDREYGEEVGAFLVVRDGTTVGLAEVTAHLRDRGLAAFKLPRRVLQVPVVPLTGIGKVDRRALRALAAATDGPLGPHSSLAVPAHGPCPPPDAALASTTADGPTARAVRRRGNGGS